LLFQPTRFLFIRSSYFFKEFLDMCYSDIVAVCRKKEKRGAGEIANLSSLTWNFIA